MRIRVQGKSALGGIYRPSGNANAGQALLAAALLTDEPVILRNMPRTQSTLGMMAQARQLGAVVEWIDEAALRVEASQLTRRTLAQNETDASVGVILSLIHI